MDCNINLHGSKNKMDEILEYIKTQTGLDEESYLSIMIEKFKEKDVEIIVEQLTAKGILWNPYADAYKYLGKSQAKITIIKEEK